MLGESKEIEAWMQDQENLAGNKSPTIAELDKIERNLGEYSKRIQYLKDTSSKLPKVRLLPNYFEMICFTHVCHIVM